MLCEQPGRRGSAWSGSAGRVSFAAKTPMSFLIGWRRNNGRCEVSRSPRAEGNGGRRRRKRLRPWPPPEADLPSLAELERLSWGEGPEEQQRFAFMAEDPYEAMARRIKSGALPQPLGSHDGPGGAGVVIPGGMPRDTVVG